MYESTRASLVDEVERGVSGEYMVFQVRDGVCMNQLLYVPAYHRDREIII